MRTLSLKSENVVEDLGDGVTVALSQTGNGGTVQVLVDGVPTAVWTDDTRVKAFAQAVNDWFGRWRIDAVGAGRITTVTGRALYRAATLGFNVMEG